MWRKFFYNYFKKTNQLKIDILKRKSSMVEINVTFHPIPARYSEYNKPFIMKRQVEACSQDPNRILRSENH